MANQLIIDRALDANGYIAPGAKATVYADGTTTLIDVYSDTSGTVAAANPVVADADGFWPQRFVTEVAKIVVTDADDVALYTLDPVPVSQGTASAASGVSFSPSVDVPEANVQDAIDYVATLAVAGFSAFGLGITGIATLLANLDATNTGAGVYRFDGTTTGTFPSGVSAADTGMIELWRQAGATAMMELHHATTNRVFRRRMTATVWGAWREEINVDQTTAEGDIIYRGSSDWRRLAKGTAGQVLKMNSGATAPEWGAPGARVLLATKTASASATLNFTEFNNAIYKWYEFEIEDLLPATDTALLRMLFSTNGGSSYDAGASDYSYGNVVMEDGGTPQNGNNTAATFINLQSGYGLGLGNAAGELGVNGTLKLYGAGSAASKTKIGGLLHAENSIGRLTSELVSGRRTTAQDTDAVRFLMSTGNITSGTIRMYGIAA